MLAVSPVVGAERWQGLGGFLGHTTRGSLIFCNPQINQLACSEGRP